MDTWGRRGFAAAVITGGMLGLSGAQGDTGRWTGSARPEPGTPHRPAVPPRADAGMAAAPTALTPVIPGPAPEPGLPEGGPAGPGATRYGAPDYPREQASAGHRMPEPAERTMVAPIRPEQAAARHAAPNYPGLDSPTAGLSDLPVGGPGAHAAPGAGPHTPAALQAPAVQNPAVHNAAAHPPAAQTPVALQGSDGFLAGNLAALPAPPANPAAGTPIGSLASAEAELGTGFSGYGTEYGRAESRHARPEQPEQYPSAELFAERSASSEAHTMLVPQVGARNYLGQPTSYQSEQSVRSVELVGAGYSAPGGQSGGGHQQGQATDSETSALGSLDSSGLFGSLSRPPR